MLVYAWLDTSQQTILKFQLKYKEMYVSNTSSAKYKVKINMVPWMTESWDHTIKAAKLSLWYMGNAQSQVCELVVGFDYGGCIWY